MNAGLGIFFRIRLKGDWRHIVWNATAWSPSSAPFFFLLSFCPHQWVRKGGLASSDSNVLSEAQQMKEPVFVRTCVCEWLKCRWRNIPSLLASPHLAHHNLAALFFQPPWAGTEVCTFLIQVLATAPMRRYYLTTSLSSFTDLIFFEGHECCMACVAVFSLICLNNSVMLWSQDLWKADLCSAVWRQSGWACGS